MSAADRPILPGFVPPVLVGRERELGVLRPQLAAALAGQGGLVLIGGEAGIGKTALAEALCRDAVMQGALVLTGRCYDLTETPPYGPWGDLFAQYHVRSDLPPLPAAFAQHGTVGEVRSQTVLFQQVGDFFTALTASRPLVLLLDDAQWMDAASLDLLRFIARTLPMQPLLILVTYRSDEITRRHPLYLLLPLLVRESSAVRVDLGRLSAGALRTIVARRYHLGESDTTRLVSYVEERTDGNALFTVELLRTLEEQGVLREMAAEWQVGDLSWVAVPMLLRQVIDGRVARLGEEAQHLLALAAVIGQEVPLDVWATVAETDEDLLAEAVESGMAAGLLIAHAGGERVQFAHALVREAIYEGVPTVRRRRLHRQAGEALMDQLRPDPDAVAHHFRQARDDRARAWLLKAAERAERAATWLMAADRVEAALSLTPATTANAGQRGWLFLRIGWLRRFADVPAGVAVSEEASRLAMEADDPALLVSAMLQLGIFLCRIPALERGVAALERGLAALETLPAHELARRAAIVGTSVSQVRSGPWSSLVMYLGHAGRYREVRSICAGHITTIIVSADFDARAVTAEPTSQRGLALTYTALGMPLEAQAAFARSRIDERRPGNPMGVAHLTIHELVWLVLPYRADQVADRQALVKLLDEAFIRASGILLDSQDHHLAYVILWVLEGRWAEARETAIHGYATATNISNRLLAMYALSALARHQGERDRGWTLVNDSFPAGPSTPPGDTYYLDGMFMQRYAAYLALDGGDLVRARAWLEAHDRWLEWGEAVLGRADGALAWASYRRTMGDADSAKQRAQEALAHATEPRQPLALLEAHRLLGELDTDAGRYRDAAAHLDAALVLADACAMPFERARTLLAFAALHSAQGEAADALRLLDEVRAICEPLDARPALARADALLTRLNAITELPPMYPAGLSAREVEVLRLLASGKTNREIADALFLAPGTVNVHVTHIFTKTNTTNRTEAALFARDHGLA